MTAIQRTPTAALVTLWILLGGTSLAMASKIFAVYRGSLTIRSAAPLLFLWSGLVLVEGFALLQLTRGRRSGRSLAAVIFILLGANALWRAWEAATSGGGPQDVGRAIGGAMVAGIMCLLVLELRRTETDERLPHNQRAAERADAADEVRVG